MVEDQVEFLLDPGDPAVGPLDPRLDPRETGEEQPEDDQ
jgi:hypothetical protein